MVPSQQMPYAIEQPVTPVRKQHRRRKGFVLSSESEIHFKKEYVKYVEMVPANMAMCLSLAHWDSSNHFVLYGRTYQYVGTKGN